MGWALALKDAEVELNSCPCRVSLQCTVIVKWLKVTSSALNVRVNFLFLKLSIVYVSMIPHVCFLVTCLRGGSFHTIKEAMVSIPGSCCIQSGHRGGDDFPLPPLRCIFSVGARL